MLNLVISRSLKCWILVCPWFCGTGMSLCSWEILHIRLHCVREDSWNKRMQELYRRFVTLLEGQQIESSYHFRWNIHCMKNWNRLELRALETSVFLVGNLTSELSTRHKPELSHFSHRTMFLTPWVSHGGFLYQPQWEGWVMNSPWSPTYSP